LVIFKLLMVNGLGRVFGVGLFLAALWQVIF